jgi:hypothetical protein
MISLIRWLNINFEIASYYCVLQCISFFYYIVLPAGEKTPSFIFVNPALSEIIFLLDCCWIICFRRRADSGEGKPSISASAAEPADVDKSDDFYGQDDDINEDEVIDR